MGVNFTRVNKTKAMYEESRVNVKVERGSTCMRNFSFIASISFTHVNFTRARTLILRDSFLDLLHGVCSRLEARVRMKRQVY